MIMIRPLHRLFPLFNGLATKTMAQRPLPSPPPQRVMNSHLFSA